MSDEDVEGNDLDQNVSHRLDRVPNTATERTVEGRPSREEIVDWWQERFGIPPETFEGHTFWEKGAGKIWAYAGNLDSPIEAESLGMSVLRTRQEHWKPTTEAAQRWGEEATRNVIVLDRERARRFVAGEDQEIEWDGDWGYLIVAHEFAGGRAPLGVGLYLHGELRSQIPKGRRREI